MASRKQDKRDKQAIIKLLDDDDGYTQTTGRSLLQLREKTTSNGDVVVVLEGNKFDYDRRQVEVSISYLLQNVCKIEFVDGTPSQVQWVINAKSSREAIVQYLISNKAWYEWIPMKFDTNASFDLEAIEENIFWKGKCGAYTDFCPTLFKISLCANDFQRPTGTTFISIQTSNGPCEHVKHKNYGFSSKSSKMDAAVSNTATNQYQVIQSMSDIAIQSGNRQVCFIS